jgi:hypothetical protein
MIEMTTTNAKCELHILLHAHYVYKIHICGEYLAVLLLKVCLIENSHHFQPKIPNQTPVTLK